MRVSAIETGYVGAVRELVAADFNDLVTTPRILDGRDLLNINRWCSAGWVIPALGRPAR